jgi:DNA modification methylase
MLTKLNNCSLNNICFDLNETSKLDPVNIEKINLILGDSLKELKKIKSESIDLVFSDPPYFLSNNGYSVSGGKRVSVNKGE